MPYRNVILYALLSAVNAAPTESSKASIAVSDEYIYPVLNPGSLHPSLSPYQLGHPQETAHSTNLPPSTDLETVTPDVSSIFPSELVTSETVIYHLPTPAFRLHRTSSRDSPLVSDSTGSAQLPHRTSNPKSTSTVSFSSILTIVPHTFAARPLASAPIIAEPTAPEAAPTIVVIQDSDPNKRRPDSTPIHKIGIIVAIFFSFITICCAILALCHNKHVRTFLSPRKKDADDEEAPPIWNEKSSIFNSTNKHFSPSWLKLPSQISAASAQKPASKPRSRVVAVSSDFPRSRFSDFSTEYSSSDGALSVIYEEDDVSVCSTSAEVPMNAESRRQTGATLIPASEFFSLPAPAEHPDSPGSHSRINSASVVFGHEQSTATRMSVESFESHQTRGKDRRSLSASIIEGSLPVPVVL